MTSPTTPSVPPSPSGGAPDGSGTLAAPAGAEGIDGPRPDADASRAAAARAREDDRRPHADGRFATLTSRYRPLRQTEREARVWVRTWKGAVVNGVLTPLLFLGAMGLGLGGLIDDNSGDVEGLRYLAFVAPGIMAAAALQSAAGDALWPVMSGIKWTKTFHAATATPLAPTDVYTGYLVWVGTRLAMNATAFLAIATLLGAVPSAWGVLAVPAAVAGGLAFAAPLCGYSARQDSDLSFPIIMRILVMPMFLFSGTFFAVDQLPVGVRPLAWVTPLWHAVELARGATTGTLDLLPALGHVGFLVACIGLGWALGARAFERKLAS